MCGVSPPTDGKTQCQLCIDKQAIRDKQQYKRRKLSGLCPSCGVNQAVDGKTYCQTCLNKDKQRYEYRKQNGSCTKCGSNAVDGKTLCQWCVDKKAIRDKQRYEERKQNRLCPMCGKNPSVDGKTLCQPCLDQAKEYSKRWYENNGKQQYEDRKLSGLCIRCSEKPVEGQTMCKDCSFKDSVRVRVRKAIQSQGVEKLDHTFALVGCTIGELRTWLEDQFTVGMSWENYGEGGWHVDHIKPLSLFDLSKEEEQRKACHYTNLQPLWATDNLSKGNKYDPSSE